jgi:sulfonate transport system substrate-binding protein
VKVVWVGPFPALAPQIEAMNAGSLDFAVGGATAFSSALSGSAPVTVFGFEPMRPSYEGILVPQGSKLKNAQDLIGKKIAVNRGGTGEYLLLKALARHNIAVSQVTRAYLSPPDAASAFALKQVDAWAVWDPFNSIAQINQGGLMLLQSDAIGSDNAIVTVVRTGFLQQHRGVTRLVFRALQHEDEWAIAHRNEASAIWAKANHLSAKISTMLASHASLPLSHVGPKQVAQIDRVAEFMYDHKLIPQKPNVSAHVVDLSNGGS